MKTSSNDFEVANFILCDYATNDALGKSILIGVYSREVRFSETPSHWIPLVFHLVIAPNVQEFPFVVELVRPNGRKLFRMNGNYRLSAPPAPNETFNLNIQLPPAPFTGLGDYELQVRDQADQIVFATRISFVVGPPLTKQVEISGQFEFDAEVIGPTTGQAH